MRQSGGVPKQQWPAPQVPWPVRFLGRLVLEVLPATLASLIGAFLLAYSQFSHGAVPPASVPAAQSVPAAADMVRLVREEHAMVRDFLLAQQEDAKKRAEAADAADARAVADATLAAGGPQRAATAAAAKPPAPQSKRNLVAAAAPTGTSSATAQLPPVVIAAVHASEDAPPAAPRPANASLISRTLAVPGHVVAMTLHAVMAVGGIPSWIGHRVGADRLEDGEAIASAAS